MYTILLALDNPTVHYLSLDIEGPELQVLRTVPLHKVDIKILDIETFHLGKGWFDEMYCLLVKLGNLLIFIPQVFDGSQNALRRYLEENGYDAFMTVEVDEVRCLIVMTTCCVMNC